LLVVPVITWKPRESEVVSSNLALHTGTRDDTALDTVRKTWACNGTNHAEPKI
jgi:hypothetical protein